MANRRKGEVELEAGERIVMLRFSTNAICTLEDDLGVGINELGGQMGDPSKFKLSMLRSIVRACMTDKVTPEEAGDIIDAAGIEATGEAIGKAFQAAFPNTKGTSEGNGKAAAGTGTNS